MVLNLYALTSRKKIPTHCSKSQEKDAGLWLAKQFWDPPGDV